MGLFIWVPKYHSVPKVLAQCQNSKPKFRHLAERIGLKSYFGGQMYRALVRNQQAFCHIAFRFRIDGEAKVYIYGYQSSVRNFWSWLMPLSNFKWKKTKIKRFIFFVPICKPAISRYEFFTVCAPFRLKLSIDAWIWSSFQWYLSEFCRKETYLKQSACPFPDRLQLKGHTLIKYLE